MKTQLTMTLAALGLLCGAAFADSITENFGWEDGTSTDLGWYGQVGGTANVTDYAHTGTNSLYMYEDPIGGTPQVFVAWITGLTDGDVIDASFWGFFNDIGAGSGLRIWSHYTDSTDITGYLGSSGGNSTYIGADAWEQTSHSFTFDSDSGARSGVVIEARMYSSAGQNYQFYVDDLETMVTSAVGGPSVNGRVTIYTPGDEIPAPGALALLGLAGLVRRRRR